MRTLSNPTELLKKLQKSPLYQDWQKNHPYNYLSHFFTPLSKNFTVKADWEIGFFNPETKKITVFAPLKEDFEIKPAEDVFKKQTAQVEKLDLTEVKTSLEKAGELCQEDLPQLFPGEQLGDGFLILQKFEGKTLWNFTFITKTLKFVNLKINAERGVVEKHDTIELIQR